jgi:hypothetical protein
LQIFSGRNRRPGAPITKTGGGFLGLASQCSIRRRRRISDRWILTQFAAAVIRRPRDVIAQDEINRSQKDWIGQSDASRQPELKPGFGHSEVFAHRRRPAGDLRGAMEQSGLELQHA